MNIFMDNNMVFPVIIECMTFNQSSYIVDTMNGFTMQDTSFPYLCIVMDDNSTDGEQTVIMDYVRDNFNISDTGNTEETDDYVMTYAQHKENTNCSFAVFLLKYNHYQINKNKEGYYTRWKSKSAYLALCEGDDYWIDPLKLQKQVDFLESNSDYGMCYGKVFHLNQEKGTISSKAYGGPETAFDEIIKGSTIPTLTVLYRNFLHERYLKEIQPETKGWLMGDYPLWIYVSSVSKVLFIDEVFGVYRVLKNSASHFTSFSRCEAFLKSDYEMRSYMIDYLGKKEYQSIIDDIMLDAFIHHSFAYKERAKTTDYLIKKKELTLQQRIIKYGCKTKVSFAFVWFVYKFLQFNKKVTYAIFNK